MLNKLLSYTNTTLDIYQYKSLLVRIYIIFLVISLSIVQSGCIGVIPLSSIAVTPVNSSVPLGFTQQFTATGTYTNGST